MKLVRNSGSFAMAIAAALFAANLDAKTLYVDPTGGTVSSDDYDGSEEVWQGAGTTNGPMKTLAAVMKKASSGDTIIALPGYYNEGVSNPEALDSTTTLMRRVIVTTGVTLKSKEGPENTFIVGEASSDTGDRGCGVNAVGCVRNSGTLKGFTLTGGRTLSGHDGSTNKNSNFEGGGVYGGTVVDCIISNNACGLYGGGARNANLYRCRFYNNSAWPSCGDGMFGSYPCRSCYFHDCEPRNTTLYNCTIGSAARVTNCTLYNCLANSTTRPEIANKYYRCLYVSALSGDVYADECVQMSAGTVKVDDRGVVTNGIELVRDMGNNDHLSDWPSSVDLVDIVGTSRILNGTVDIGAFEYDPSGDVSGVLSPAGAVTVTNMNAAVICLANTVSVGAGGEIKGVLNLSKSDSPTQWTFLAKVEGAGTLKVFFGDAAEPSRTVTSAEGQVEVSCSGSEPTGVRLVYDGAAGAAEVCRFTRDTVLVILADEAGLAVTGDCTEPGVYVVAPGETKMVTVARSATATRFVSGLNVDGVFYDFNMYLDGIVFAVTGSVRSSSHHIRAVYSYAANRDWFVDPVKGSDGNCGLYTNLAFKTLAAAATAATMAGDRIFAAPGVYNEGGMDYGSLGSNRVILTAGVLLEGYGGAAVTTIEGKISELPDSTNGCGADSMRAVAFRGSSTPADVGYYGTGGVVKGFTITKGRSTPNSTEKNCRGGGVYGPGLVVDCVFSNNVAASNGNSASATCLLRCYIGDDPAGYYSGYSAVTLVDCVQDNARNIYSYAYAHNTTFLRGSLQTPGGGNPAHSYNCVFRGSSPSSGSDLYSCICNKAQTTGSVDADGRSMFSVSLDDIAHEEGTYRPLSGSLAIDAGDKSYTDSLTSKWPQHWKTHLRSDYAGGQRVYNDGKIDVGAGEYDWRGSFAKGLAAKGVSVAEAGENVTTNAMLGIDVPAGDALKMKLSLKTSGRVTFKVDAEDTAAVQVVAAGVPVAIGEGGVVSFDAAEGETVVEVSCSGGTATVSSVVLPKLGVLLILR